MQPHSFCCPLCESDAVVFVDAEDGHERFECCDCGNTFILSHYMYADDPVLDWGLEPEDEN